VEDSCEYSNIFGFHKMLGSSRVAVQLAASQEGLSSMKLLVTVQNNMQLCMNERVTSRMYTGRK
jgi:hypothetical protein